MYYPCCCKEFGVGTPWEIPAPEEQQRCSLVEWVRGVLRKRMEADEMIIQEHLARELKLDAEAQRRIDEHNESWEANFGGDEWECEWGHAWEEEYVLVDSEGSAVEGEQSEDWWSVVQDGVEPEVLLAWR